MRHVLTGYGAKPVSGAGYRDTPVESGLRGQHRKVIAVVAMNRSEEQILAAVAAGHEMAGMPLESSDVEAMQRLSRGESSVADERARILAEIEADRP